MEQFIGVDQGTTATKVSCVYEDGRAQLVYQKNHRQITPEPGWVEHDGDEIYNNIVEALDKTGPGSALGIDHQGESIVAWDKKSKKCFYNVIVWQDSRTSAWIENLKKDGLEPVVQEKTCLPLDPYFPASKMRWILDNVPEAKTALKKGRLCMGTMDSFFIHRLTNVFSTDYNSASRTCLFNVRTLAWDRELCDIFGVPMEVLPPVVSNLGDFGCFGSTPVTASIIDQFAGIYGHGCRKAGDFKFTFGTGGFMQALSGESIVEDKKYGLLPCLCWKFGNEAPMFGVDGGIYNAASAINWARSLTLFDEYEELNDFSYPSAIERNLAFVPALSGLACPYWDRSAAGLWAGLHLGTTRKDMMQAVVEGIALRAATILNVTDQIVPLKEEMKVDGGITENPYFLQFLADITRKNVIVPDYGQISSYGAALLARKGLGKEDSPVNTACSQVTWKDKTQRDYLKYFEKMVLSSRGTRKI